MCAFPTSPRCSFCRLRELLPLVPVVPTYNILLYVLYSVKFFLFLGHDMLQAVKQQQQRFGDLREQFARRLASHLNSVFVHQVLFLTILCEIFSHKLFLTSKPIHLKLDMFCDVSSKQMDC